MEDGSFFARLDEGDRKRVRSALKLGSFTAWGLIVLVVLLSSIAPYASYLWFKHDVQYLGVFDATYRTRGLLFLITFVVTWAFVFANLRQALKATLVYLRSPESSGQAALTNLLEWVRASGVKIAKVAAPIFALFTALGFSNEWNTYLLATHPEPFGVVDPTFGMDLGFFVFTLPWMRAISNLVFSITLLTAVVTVAAYSGLQVLGSMAKVELSRPSFRLHVNGLLALVLLSLSAQSWLRSFEIGYVDSGQFTGAGFAGSQVVMALRIFAALAVIGAVVTLATTHRVRTYSIPLATGIALAVVYAVGVVAYPAVVQAVVVNPNRVDRESTFAGKAIRMTRFAYGLDQVDVRDFGVSRAPTADQVKAASVSLTDIRLWDPEILRQSIEGLQAFRPYYSFPDVDIDRYRINGKLTQVMIAPRDIDIRGLDPSARNWNNERLRYTHGYGVTVSRVNGSSPNGHPDFLARDVPMQSVLKIDEPRIYFSDYRNAYQLPSDDYAVVNSGEPELDYDTGNGSQTHRWTAGRGVPMDSFLSRLAYGIALGDGNLMVSGNIVPGSRLLVHRSILERAHRLLPFLRLDTDPYLVVHNGRLIWIIDGYTATNRIPYSAMTEGGESLNYLRNSVKMTVDAYTGEVRAFAIDTRDPILRAYRRIYPGLVRDLGELPAGLQEHFRYPEDLLNIQSMWLTSYHVTDPGVFLTNSDAWQIATERDVNGQTMPIRPYYVLLKLPDEPIQGFFQILPFSPRGRQTMIGWVAAHCDPKTYGKLTLYRFTGGETVDGPGLMEGNFSSTPEISNINRQYNNDQSEIMVGNLLVLPVGDSVLYAESLFLRSRASGIQAVPRLFRVILALNDRIVVGENLADALKKLFANGATSSAPSPTEPDEGATKPTASPVARDALRLFREADTALRSGDFARYGELQKALRAKLEALVREEEAVPPKAVPNPSN